MINETQVWNVCTHQWLKKKSGDASTDKCMEYIVSPDMNVDSILFICLGSGRVDRDCNNFHINIHACYYLIPCAHRNKIIQFWHYFFRKHTKPLCSTCNSNTQHNK